MKRTILLHLLLILIQSGYTQISPQTGSATFGLPIFNWQDDRSRMSAVVALNYNSRNGIQVNEVASNIGQGWNLIAGGFITRMVNGQPDDQKPKEGASDDLTKYPPGYLYDPLSAGSGCPAGMAKYPIYKHQNQLYKQHNAYAADKELDQFTFSINGRSGLFVLGKGNGDKGISIGDSKVKIWFTRDENLVNSNIRTTINAFFIQDENGIIYKFTNFERTKILKTAYTDATATYPQVAPKFEDGGVYHEGDLDDAPALSYVINTWHLSEIEEPFTRRHIYFDYVQRTIDAKSGLSVSINQSSKLYAVISHGRSITETKFLNSIIFPDNHKIVFTYGANRIDLPGDKVLSAIDIQLDNRYEAKYLLTSGYMFTNRLGTPLTDYQKAMSRLCLRSIQKVTVDLQSIEPAFQFDYYTGAGTSGDFVPPPYTYQKDIWGYYNADNTRDVYNQPIPLNTSIGSLTFDQLQGVCFIRQNQNKPILNSKPGVAKNGLLKQIIYPTGGSIKYEYQDNYGKINNETIQTGGVHVSRISVLDGGYAYDCSSNTVVTDYSYTIENSSESSLWGIEMPTNTITTRAFYKPEKKKYKIPIFGGCGILGCCKFIYKYPGIMARENAIDLTGKQRFWQSVSSILSVLGAAMEIYDVLSAILDSNPVGLIIDIMFGLVVLVKTCFDDMSQYSYLKIFYNSDLNAINPLPVQFRRVTATESSGSPNGKTVMEFTSFLDYPIWEPNNPLHSMKQRYANWAYGLPKLTEVYNRDNQLVSQIEQSYDFSHADQANTEIYNEEAQPVQVNIDQPSCKCFVKYSYSQRNDFWEEVDNNPQNFVVNENSNDNVSAEIYRVRTGRVELVRTTELQGALALSNPSSNTISKVIQYQYESPTLQPSKITTISSNNKKEIKRMVYSGDTYRYGANNQGPILIGLINNNVLNLPISSTTSLDQVASSSQYSEKLLNETITTFAGTPDGDVKPMAIMEKRYNTPSTSYSPGNIYQGPLSATNPMYLAQQIYTYDQRGKLITVQDEGKRLVSTIYDYNDRLPVATIINSERVTNKQDCAYSSFETSSFGGWYLTSGNATYASSISITGKQSFQFTAGTKLTAYASWPKPYILSFWASTNALQIDNSNNAYSLKKSGPTFNGLTYYEYELASVGNSVSIQGTGIIDELRLYPKEARMRTVTYDPLIGKTSECDENNRITYYEYDEKGRLRFIKDEWKNIIKMQEYNIAKNHQNPACPPPSNNFFSNVEMSEYFRRNDCGKDYIGSEVLYTVPAGTYTSSISQEYVDQLAQNQINEQGQAWANNPANGSVCIEVFRNLEQHRSFITEICDYGYEGGEYVYTVPAGRYTSTQSLDDANHQAVMEIEANGQSYANMPANAVCVATTEPQWESTGNEHCQGTHLIVEMIDMNPNSNTHNTLFELDAGENPGCGGPVSPVVNITYVNHCNTPVTLKLKNLANNQLSTYMMAPEVHSVQTLISIPPGNYEVTMLAGIGSNASSMVCYSTTQNGSYFHQSSVLISAAASPMILINN